MVLRLLLESFELDNQIVEIKQEMKKRSNLPKTEEERDSLIQRKNKNLEKKRKNLEEAEKKEVDSVNDENKKAVAIKKLNTAIQQLENSIKELQNLTLDCDDIDDSIMGWDKGKNGNFKKSMNVLSMVIRLHDHELITEVLSKIGKDNDYGYLSDERIVVELFSNIFDIDEEESENVFQKLESLRAPWALILLHSRLNASKRKYRSDLKKRSQEAVKALLNGSYQEFRHQVKNNPTLNKIYEYESGLIDRWMDANEIYKVSELVNDDSTIFADYDVIDSSDPSDIALIGSDLHTCMHLGGRIDRISGLVALISDGKIHTLLVKDSNNNIVAETQLQLLWDPKNEKPVLFLEAANFIGEAENNYTLEHALYEYAKIKARGLGLALVTAYKMKDPNGCLVSSEKYNGTVKSLGGSSPLEYLNLDHKNYEGSYQIRKNWVIQS